MKKLLSFLLSYLILLQGCASTRPWQMKEVPRGACVSDMERAYREYLQATHETRQPYELLNRGVLAYEAGNYRDAVNCLARAEAYVDGGSSLIEKGMLHYYRGLAEWAMQDSAAVRSDADALQAHLRPEDPRFLGWCDQVLASAGGIAEDGGQIIVICEAGLMPPLEGETGTVPVLYSDMEYARSDSGRAVLSGALYDRWETGAVPYETAVGHVKADLQKYRYPWARMTDAVAVEAICDIDGTWPMDMAMNVGAARLEELELSQRQLLAMVPIRMEESGEPVYVEPPAVMTYNDQDRSIDRPQSKREGRREAAEPDQAKKNKDEKKKEKKEEKKKDEKKNEEKKEGSTVSSGDGGGGGVIGAILGAIVVLTVVGLVVAIVRSLSSRGHDEPEEMPSQPSWEMLPVKIFTTSFPVEPGEHNVRAIAQDAAGLTLLRYDFGNVKVQPGQTVLLRVRCMN